VALQDNYQAILRRRERCGNSKAGVPKQLCHLDVSQCLGKTWNSSQSAIGGFMDTGNYRKRVLHKLAHELELPKLTFQVIRRTIATLAQKKGTVKDV
jgi:hypothetical protein